MIQSTVMKLVLLLALGFPSTWSPAGEPSHVFTPIRVVQKEGMIIPKRLAIGLGLPYKDYWTPSDSQIKRLELRLPKYLKSQLKADPRLVQLVEIVQNEPRYRRQYVGILEHGKKLILVNCLRAKPPSGIDTFEKWDREFIEVSDGGSQFWSVLYDVEGNVFKQFNIQGKG